MHHSSVSRIIGESPPCSGGKMAESYVKPCHVGECILWYELLGVKQCARFVSYPVARTAAIRAIFSPDNGIDRVSIRKTTCFDMSAPLYSSAGAWLDEKVSIAA